VERYASGQFFRAHGREGAELAAAADRGDARARRLFAEYGRHLAHAISLVLYALAPRRIILGGSVSKSRRHFRGSLREALTTFAYPSVLRALEWRISRIKHAAVLGAATLWLNENQF